jgi:hypothetical protein
VPVGWAIDGANRNDIKLLDATLDAVAATGLLPRDRHAASRPRLRPSGGARPARRARPRRRRDQHRGTKIPGVKKQPLSLGLRWIVEATNSWLSNDGQPRRNTDRKTRHRHAALSFATTILIIGKLLTYRDRWRPK